MKILVTGGAGYIGSHTCLELLRAGHEVVVVDSLANSKQESLHRVERLSGKRIQFEQLDLRDGPRLTELVQLVKPEAVIHFAGLKAVGESVQQPLLYFNNNIIGTLRLLTAMSDLSVKRLIFSSSATVYGQPKTVPVTERAPLQVTNPYGRTKLMIEEILTDLYQSDERWNITILRYFNPVGAHPSGEIGEDPLGKPNNLFPLVGQVAVGRLAELSVFGNDYPTPDGTCVRDYLHVIDLAQGHVAALDHCLKTPGRYTYNLGTGQGRSVLEVIAAFERASGQHIPYKVVGRRPGDSASIYADPSLAARELGWRAERSLAEMCADSWRWLQQNPRGYEW